MSDNEQKKQRIIRSKPETEYFSLPNGVAQNLELPYDALGVLVYLLSKPPEWETTVFDLRKRGDGKSKIYRILKDLERVGYMKRPSKYQDKQTGKWNWTPRIVADIPVYTQPCPSKPDTGEPDTGNKEIKEVKTDKKEQIIKKDLPQPKIAVDGDGSDLDDNKMSNGWYKYTYDAILGEYHCTCCKELIGNIRNTGGVYYSPNEISLTHYCHDCFIARDGASSDLDEDVHATWLAAETAKGEVVRNCYGCGNDMFVGEPMYWTDDMPLEIYCDTCHSYDEKIGWNVTKLTDDYNAPNPDNIKWTDSVHADTLGDYIDGEIVDCEADGCDGKCEIDDVNDNTQCDTCKTEYTVQRDCSIADGNKFGACNVCEFKDGCKMINGGVYLHEPERCDSQPITPGAAIGALCEVPEVEKPKAKKVRKPKKKAHPLYKEMSDAIIDAFDHDREKMLGKDFNRIGGVANDLLARGAKPFMIKRLYDWIDKKFNTEFGYNTLDKWYLNWRSEMGDRIPDELPTKQAEEPTVSSAMIGEITLEDCQRATRELAAKMSMSNYEDNDNGS